MNSKILPVLETIVVKHLHEIDHYRPYESLENNYDIVRFVQDNITAMTWIYRVVLFILLGFLSFIHLLSSSWVFSFLNLFPFNLLHKLICGNIYIRLFEIAPIRPKGLDA